MANDFSLDPRVKALELRCLSGPIIELFGQACQGKNGSDIEVGEGL